MLDYLVIALCAFIGGSARYWLGVFLPAVGGFPIGTLAVNLIGCFIFSWVVKHIMNDIDISGRLVLGVGVGFCGALTTFSSFALDTMKLVQADQIGLAFLYLVLSFVGGLAMTFLGESIYHRRAAQ
ncbi:fluoride efflux transporter CrcB [Enterococcus viikkiensis]|uniref:Fluoride-specific ion channel FluC n=1 Tax=Enterococcus viikkiensis TaxID=930854 RepID=A0ABU3FRX8_9ENTE|nr:fluoride efflux transporter CrcB [Enterococcus viikkiensis]MDT2828398.1 fluoride efflux transporter CrcB [Enterococcus viikkiensis]